MKYFMRALGLSAVAQFLVATDVLAANPIISHIYTADPAAIVHNDRVYIYTGHDEAASATSGFRMKDWHVFSSSDMVNWTDHGEALTLNHFSWANADAWAGHVIERNGKFYWYVSVNQNSGGWMGIGVAVADSPTGPFRDALGRPLISDSMTPNHTLDIDPAVFIDHDGQAYLYWGNATDGGVCKVVKLNSDMVTTSGPIMDIGLNQVPFFTEAPYLHERNGIYYLTYAAGWPEEIHYSTADNPLGPFQYRGRINGQVSSQTNHQSIIEFRDQWYFIYHNGNLPGGGEFRRSVAIEYLHYNSDGSIRPIVQTSQGVAAVGPKDPEEPQNPAGGIIESFSTPGSFLGHRDFNITISNDLLFEDDAKWSVVPGLAGTNTVSFESVNYRGYFIRHQSYQALLQQNEYTPLFAEDASFYLRQGLASTEGVSYESYNFPGYFLMQQGTAVAIAQATSTAQRQAATFAIERSSPEPAAQSITIQESTGFCSLDGTIDNNHSGFTGSGFANSTNANGSRIQWRINAARSGTYTLTWRYVNGTSARPAAVIVNQNTQGTSNFSSTGAWNSWTDSGPVTVQLKQGENTIQLQATSSTGLVNIDSLTVTGTQPTAVNCN